MTWQGQPDSKASSAMQAACELSAPQVPEGCLQFKKYNEDILKNVGNLIVC